ncbi:hypothetical protein ACKWTF_014837 [Chironomus riparius]
MEINEPRKYNNMNELYDILKNKNLPSSIVIQPVKKFKKKIIKKYPNIFFGKIKLNKTQIDVVVKEIDIFNFRVEEIIVHLISSEIIPADRPYRDTYLNEGCEFIVKFYGCYQEKNCICIVLENAKYNFDQFCKLHNESCDKVDKLRLFHEVAKGLKFLHSNNIAHMDISTKNILIDKNGNARLSDFGEAEINIINSTIKYRQNHRQTIGYGDICSIGKVFIKILLDIEADNQEEGTLVASLNTAKEIGTVTDAEVELVLFFLESSKKRCDITAICSNPVFWQHEKTYKFLEKVYLYYTRHTSDDELLHAISSKIMSKIIPGEKSWQSFVQREISEEIKKFNNLDRAKIEFSSVFGLVKAIIYIRCPDTIIRSKTTAQNVFANSRKILLADENHVETYLKSWTNIFKNIDLYLYYFMQDELEETNSEFYSINSPSRY